MLELLFLLFCLVSNINGQTGKMIDPPHRGSMWRHGHKTTENKQDNQLNCGGLANIRNQNGECGLCGDPANNVRHHEDGEKYSSGIIGKQFPVGISTLETYIKMDSKHFGYFEFRLCVKNETSKASEKCFNQHHLQITGGSIPSYLKRYNTGKQEPKEYRLTIEIHTGIVCSHCVLQWRYISTDEYGTDEDGWSCYGCGIQRQMRNCADISIGIPTTSTPNVQSTSSPASTLASSVMLASTSTSSPTSSKPWWASHHIILKRNAEPKSEVQLEAISNIHISNHIKTKTRKKRQTVSTAVNSLHQHVRNNPEQSAFLQSLPPDSLIRKRLSDLLDDLISKMNKNENKSFVQTQFDINTTNQNKELVSQGLKQFQKVVIDNIERNEDSLIVGPTLSSNEQIRNSVTPISESLLNDKSNVPNISNNSDKKVTDHHHDAENTVTQSHDRLEAAVMKRHEESSAMSNYEETEDSEEVNSSSQNDKPEEIDDNEGNDVRNTIYLDKEDIKAVSKTPTRAPTMPTTGIEKTIEIFKNDLTILPESIYEQEHLVSKSDQIKPDSILPETIDDNIQSSSDRRIHGSGVSQREINQNSNDKDILLTGQDQFQLDSINIPLQISNFNDFSSTIRNDLLKTATEVHLGKPNVVKNTITLLHEHVDVREREKHEQSSATTSFEETDESEEVENSLNTPNYDESGKVVKDDVKIKKQIDENNVLRITSSIPKQNDKHTLLTGPDQLLSNIVETPLKTSFQRIDLVNTSTEANIEKQIIAETHKTRHQEILEIADILRKQKIILKNEEKTSLNVGIKTLPNSEKEIFRLTGDQIKPPQRKVISNQQIKYSPEDKRIIQIFDNKDLSRQQSVKSSYSETPLNNEGANLPDTVFKLKQVVFSYSPSGVGLNEKTHNTLSSETKMSKGDIITAHENIAIQAVENNVSHNKIMNPKTFSHKSVVISNVADRMLMTKATPIKMENTVLNIIDSSENNHSNVSTTASSSQKFGIGGQAFRKTTKDSVDNSMNTKSTLSNTEDKNLQNNDRISLSNSDERRLQSTEVPSLPNSKGQYSRNTKPTSMSNAGGNNPQSTEDFSLLKTNGKKSGKTQASFQVNEKAHNLQNSKATSLSNPKRENIGNIRASSTSKAKRKNVRKNKATSMSKSKKKNSRNTKTTSKSKAKRKKSRKNKSKSKSKGNKSKNIKTTSLAKVRENNSQNNIDASYSKGKGNHSGKTKTTESTNAKGKQSLDMKSMSNQEGLNSQNAKSVSLSNAYRKDLRNIKATSESSATGNNLLKISRSGLSKVEGKDLLQTSEFSMIHHKAENKQKFQTIPVVSFKTNIRDDNRTEVETTPILPVTNKTLLIDGHTFRTNPVVSVSDKIKGNNLQIPETTTTSEGENTKDTFISKIKEENSISGRSHKNAQNVRNSKSTYKPNTTGKNLSKTTQSSHPNLTGNGLLQNEFSMVYQTPDNKQKFQTIPIVSFKNNVGDESKPEVAIPAVSVKNNTRQINGQTSRNTPIVSVSEKLKGQNLQNAKSSSISTSEGKNYKSNKDALMSKEPGNDLRKTKATAKSNSIGKKFTKTTKSALPNVKGKDLLQTSEFSIIHQQPDIKQEFQTIPVVSFKNNIWPEYKTEEEVAPMVPVINKTRVIDGHTFRKSTVVSVSEKFDGNNSGIAKSTSTSKGEMSKNAKDTFMSKTQEKNSLSGRSNSKREDMRNTKVNSKSNTTGKALPNTVQSSLPDMTGKSLLQNEFSMVYQSPDNKQKFQTIPVVSFKNKLEHGNKTEGEATPVVPGISKTSQINGHAFRKTPLIHVRNITSQINEHVFFKPPGAYVTNRTNQIDGHAFRKTPAISTENEEGPVNEQDLQLAAIFSMMYDNGQVDGETYQTIPVVSIKNEKHAATESGFKNKGEGNVFKEVSPDNLNLSKNSEKFFLGHSSQQTKRAPPVIKNDHINAEVSQTESKDKQSSNVSHGLNKQKPLFIVKDYPEIHQKLTSAAPKSKNDFSENNSRQYPETTKTRLEPTKIPNFKSDASTDVTNTPVTKSKNENGNYFYDIAVSPDRKIQIAQPKQATTDVKKSKSLKEGNVSELLGFLATGSVIETAPTLPNKVRESTANITASKENITNTSKTKNTGFVQALSEAFENVQDKRKDQTSGSVSQLTSPYNNLVGLGDKNRSIIQRILSVLLRQMANERATKHSKILGKIRPSTTVAPYKSYMSIGKSASKPMSSLNNSPYRLGIQQKYPKLLYHLGNDRQDKVTNRSTFEIPSPAFTPRNNNKIITIRNNKHIGSQNTQHSQSQFRYKPERKWRYPKIIHKSHGQSVRQETLSETKVAWNNFPTTKTSSILSNVGLARQNNGIRILKTTVKKEPGLSITRVDAIKLPPLFIKRQTVKVVQRQQPVSPNTAFIRKNYFPFSMNKKRIFIHKKIIPNLTVEKRRILDNIVI